MPGLLRYCCDATGSSNATPKRLKSQHGDDDILTPRDWDGSFEPQLLRKN